MSASAEAIELVKSVDSTMESLMAEHVDRREHWYYHDFIEWEKGESFKNKPWDESESTLSPEVRTAFVLNLLTEDNLPYYTSLFGKYFDDDSIMKRWSRLWTAEEGQHAIAMRAYLMTSRNCDPRALEDDRMATVVGGWDPGFETVVDMFCYTSAQELATRISHRNTGVQTGCEVAHTLMTKIARDENYHFLFYRGATTEMLAQAPNIVIPALNRVLQNFDMPGTKIPGFGRRALQMARVGIYNQRIHAENIVEPLLRFWKIEDITDLSPEAEQARDEIMQIIPMLIKGAEKFEARQARQALSSTKTEVTV